MSVFRGAHTLPVRTLANKAFVAHPYAGQPQAFHQLRAVQPYRQSATLHCRWSYSSLRQPDQSCCMHNQLNTMSTRCFCAHSEPGSSKEGWDVKMLYDGDCPLCMREVNMLKKRDKTQNKICFVDIASKDYSPASNAGISYEQAMGSIHGVLPGGQVITNVDVFRKLYEVVGLGWVYSITKFGPINKIANRVYAVWAKYRLPLTGRPDLEVVLRDKQAKCKPASSQSS